MKNVVIDACLSTAWCFPDEETPYTNGVLQLAGVKLNLIAPVLWAYEVRNTVLTGVRRGRISREYARKLLVFLNDLEVRLSPPVTCNAVFELADRYGLTVYDAAYLELALRECAPLASLDQARCRAAATAGVQLLEV